MVESCGGDVPGGGMEGRMSESDKPRVVESGVVEYKI